MDFQTFLLWGIVAIAFYFLVYRNPKFKPFFDSLLSGKIDTSSLSTTTTTTTAPPIIPTTNPSVATPTVTDPRIYSKLQYKGGPVMKNAKVYFIYWGVDWNRANLPASRTTINTAMQKLFSSQYFDGLQQYGISRPVIGGTVDNFTYPVPQSTDIPWQEIPKVILDSIKHGMVPSPDPPNSPLDYFYFVWVPPNHNVPGYGGLHLYSTTPKGTTFTWAGVVYPSAAHPLIPDITDNLTQAFTHEIVDSMTNPTAQQGYVVSPCTNIPGDPHTYQWDPSGCEIAQWCGHILDRSPATNNVLVEAYYSNKDARCIIPNTDVTPADAVY